MLATAMINTKDLTKISLAQFLNFYKQPITEEQAWAICFHCCCKMNQVLAQDLNSVVEVLDIDSLYIHSDGSISFTIQHNEDGHINQQPREILEDKWTELLGKLIYKALDWGIESHMERELSESLEKLISFMLKLNAETAKPAVAFQDVIKICEDHFHKPSEAASHYTTICQVLFSEYIEVQQLMLTVQNCKEHLGRMDVEDNKTTKNWDFSISSPSEGILSSYGMVVDDIKNKRYDLHTVSDEISSDAAFIGHLHCLFGGASSGSQDLKGHQVSSRKLKEKAFQEPSLHDQLMLEVKNPPKLRPTTVEKSGNSCKKNSQTFIVTSPHKGIFFEQNISTIDFSKVKKTGLSWIQSELKELKAELGELSSTCNQTSRWLLPTIADLMGTRYFRIKDSCQRNRCDTSSRAKVCISCHNQFFIWPYVCHLCGSVICKNCCMKMSMPVRPCVRLPLNFFKAIQLGKEGDQALQDHKATQLLSEVEQWDLSRVPLVFEPHCITPPLACRAKSMMDWPSMDICIQCEQYLLEILSSHPPCRKRHLPWTEVE